MPLEIVRNDITRDTYAVTAESAKGQCIVSIISTDLGKKCQDEYMEDR